MANKSEELKQTALKRIPITLQQKRSWRLCQLSDAETYGAPVPLIIRVKGKLNISKLTEALSNTARRHDALRTRIEIFDGQPVQLVYPHEAFELKIEDLSNRNDQEAAAQNLSSEFIWQLSNMQDKKLFRAVLLIMANDEHILVICIDHIISDGYSLKILIQDVCRIYNSNGDDSIGAEAPGQYSEYALKQSIWMESPAAKSHMEHWDCTAAQSIFPLPDYKKLPPAADNDFMPPFVGFSLSDSLVSQLFNRASREGATLYILLFSVYAHLLTQWADRRELTISSLVLGRNNAEFTDTIGFFSSTILSQITVPQNASFIQTLHASRKALIQANKHQAVPAEAHRATIVPRINFLNYEIYGWNLQGVQVTTLDAPLDPRLLLGKDSITQFQREHPIELHLMQGSDGLRCMLYSADWSIKYNNLQAFADDYQKLLADIV